MTTSHDPIWTIYNPYNSHIWVFKTEDLANQHLLLLQEESQAKKIDCDRIIKQSWDIGASTETQCWIALCGGLIGVYANEQQAIQARQSFLDSPETIPLQAAHQVEIFSTNIKCSEYVESYQIAGIIKNYSLIAGAAAEFELRTRLLANKISHLKASAKSASLADLEKKIVLHYSTLLTDHEKTFLQKTRIIRNKLIHSDFKSLMKHIESLHQTELDRNRISGLVIDKETGQARVLDKEKDELGIFFLLLQYASSGGFQKAYDTFKDAIDIISKCLMSEDA